MDFTHAADRRFHIEDVIRGFATPMARTHLGRRDDTPDPDAAGSDGRTLVGYPIVFNQWTEIASWGGPFLERIAPEAVTKTLTARGDKIQLMFNHGFDYMLEQTPIGRHQVWRPDDHGVWNEARLVDEDVYDKIDLVAELIRMEAIYGQSFRFSVLSETWVDEPDVSPHNPKGLPERTITELRLYESGPVTYPAYEATSVSLRDGQPFAVRSREEWTLWCETRSLPPSVTLDAQPPAPSPVIPFAARASVLTSTSVDGLAEFVASAGR